jgi:hypothetical protein
MVWRITTIRDGAETHDAAPYAAKEDALTVIKMQLDRGLIESAWIMDHDYNRIEWPEIKGYLGLP